MSKHTSARILGIAFLSLVVLSYSDHNSWAKYPDKAITAIICWNAGGSIDLTARPLINAASRIIGQPIAIEYRPGGSGAVGLSFLKFQKPDGYIIGATSTSSLIQQYLHKVDYDLLKDFTTVIQYSIFDTGLVVQASSPWKNLIEFVNYAKANPRKIRFSSPGPGNPNALAMASLAKQLQIDWVHIPFEGSPAALAAVLGGHVEAYTTTMHCKPHILTGRLRLLVSFGERRIASFPDVPTLHELGIPIVAPNFNALFAPKGPPPEILETLHQAFKKALQDPEFIKACDSVDQTIVYRGPREAAEHFPKLGEEIRRVTQDIKQPKK